MPGYGSPHVKCEPPSDTDEDDSNSQISLNFGIHQVPSSTQTELRPIKPEPESTSLSHRQHVPTNFLQHLQTAPSLEELGGGAPAGPAATPVCVKHEPPDGPPRSLETLEPAAHTSCAALELSLMSSEEIQSEFMPLLVKDEPGSEGEQHQLSGSDTSDSCGAETTRTSPKSWTQRDMDNALTALRTHNMSLTKASATYGIPSTTLWQRAHRLGIDTPKKEGTSKSWSEADLKGALQALRAGAISANKASKAYGIPSSTLYKIARREGIRLAAPFNAAPTSWRPSDLERALQAIRCGHASVQRASAQFGIPTGTLYGRCKREGIELSRSNPTPWSEDAMGEALEAVRVGQMSINQAAIHYNLPYSSLYGRFKRCKYPQSPQPQQQQQPGELENPGVPPPGPPAPAPYQHYPPAPHELYHAQHALPADSHVTHHEVIETHDQVLASYHHHQPETSDHAHQHPHPHPHTHPHPHPHTHHQQQHFNAMYYGQSIATS